ncbi:sugar transferase [Roseovarius sp.]|uniref:sugar transferase n=1 Tax=Roseovarius sp. TaxID=1486281 RepID=UPI003BAC0433
MTASKRLMDIGLALILVVILALPTLVVALWVLAVDGRPVFYPSERMKTPDTPFTLWKFRTMRTDRNDSGVSGGYKTARITRTGRILRGKRLDELPQLFNILRGDMSFVGPRPPLRRYVELRPDLYARVLRNRPGVTGLATLRYHAREEKLLARCADAAETERVYLRRCVPAKARLDLIWAHNRSVCYDAALIVETVRRVLLRTRPK